MRLVVVVVRSSSSSNTQFDRAGFNWWEAWGEIKIEGFGGRPTFGGRPNAK